MASFSMGRPTVDRVHTRDTPGDAAVTMDQRAGALPQTAGSPMCGGAALDRDDGIGRAALVRRRGVREVAIMRPVARETVLAGCRRA